MAAGRQPTGEPGATSPGNLDPVMKALIIGGDRVASYSEFLLRRGYATIQHWNGRKKSECHRQLPADTRLVVVLVDQVNHLLALKARRAANKMQVPIVFSRRCLSHLDEALAGIGT